MKTTLEFKFQIGERVYYNLPEGPVGIITDITWRHTTGIICYYVTFDPQCGEIACRDWELSREPVLV